MVGAPELTGWAGLFRTAFERSANPMLLLQIDRVIVDVNQAVLDLLGYARDQLIGRRSTSLAVPRYMRQVEADWTELVRTGRVTGDRHMMRSDGEEVHVHYAAHMATVTERELVLWVVLPDEPGTIPASRDGGRAEGALTPREREVVSEIAMGLRVHEIARRLFVSPSTVRTHVRNAMAKTGARSQAQLVAIALSECLLDPDCVHRSDGKS